VTNDHVVAEADRISVTFADGTIADAELVGTDRDSDLAVVQVDLAADQLRPIEVASSDGVEVGDLVVALGNPFGLENTMTVGFVSALGRSLPVQASGMGPTYSIPDVIQTDASINPGNSGGAMVNNQGQLVGVPSAIRSPVRASVGVGFAIPSAIVQKVVPALIETGTYTHPWLGISGLPLTPDIARAMNLEPDQRGALVVTVVDGSPADEAGLRGSDREVTIQGQTVRVGGDVITQFNNRPVNEFTDLIAYLERYTEVGDEVDLTILRDGAPQTVTVTLQGRPSQETRQASRADAQAPWLGIIGITLEPEIAERMDYPTDQDGVLVVRVEAGSPADEAGLRGSFRSATIEGQSVLIGGDIITAFSGEPVSDVEALRSALQQASTGETVTLTILRDGEEQEIEATLVERPNS
jgi:S1-C subfamily serine protease